MIGSEHIATYLQVATLVVPVALYFLILGLLNSRRHPQLLTSRQDFALLTGAMGLMAVMGIVTYLGTSLPVAMGSIAGIGGLLVIFAPSRRSWVVYNMPPGEAREVIRDVLENMGHSLVEEPYGFRIRGATDKIIISSFPMLKNVTIRLRDCRDGLAEGIGSGLGQALGRIDTETSPMAASMLLVATAMIIAPMALVMQKAPEIVRLLTDLLNY